jgi:3-aminobutyryl-CoA ammonia-lyase
MNRERSVLRVRMSPADVHYGEDLVGSGRMMALFGDVATELCILHDGDEGLFRSYETVEFLAPVHAGDFLVVSGEILDVGRSSRRMKFEAVKVVCPRPDISKSAADVLEEPILVARAVGTCVVPPDRQRKVMSA